MSGLVAEQAKAESVKALGLYVHVPFCASTCDFCAFYQEQPTATTVKGFLTDIGREAKLVRWARPIETIFWGGGTPGLLAPADLAVLGETMREICGGPVREWSVELAPASVTEARLAALRAAGVTRISLGVQSFRPELLDALGRQHTREQVFRAYERIRAAGFESVNLDLMFALPGQDESAWLEDLRQAVALQPDHLSTYCLTFEEDTKLWVKLSKGAVKLDPVRERELYERTWEFLGTAGFAQYEVSNFARPGHACQHNVNTWHMHEWVGLGPSAASQHDGLRGANIADLAKWSERIGRGERATEDRVSLTPELLAEDALIFGLRMNAGVDTGPWRARAPAANWGEVDALLARMDAEGLAIRSETRVRLTDRGRLVADAVGVEVMNAFASHAVGAS
ncbi:radical SAM family heme chaperone HemW [Horticoccus luteus]|uniref:Heme chaperone HemW n=1 Tax=Horticoccus luteus TaxID=2862869 RepID=A0A8F9XMW5_9BACT|nr:radical SAM family heme chaperone HemW [Horticoccus luteus]